MATQCSVEGCDRPHYAKGYCQLHHKRLLRHGSPTGGAPYRKSDGLSLCRVEGCAGRGTVHGFCRTHWQRVLKHGDPTRKLRPGNGTVARYFYETVASHDANECLIWPFARNQQGYATWHGQIVSRFSCTLENGPPPTAQHEAAHSCGRGHEGCVAKRHMRWATPIQNNMDKALHGTLLTKLTEPQIP
jgi:hypothetical protein